MGLEELAEALEAFYYGYNVAFLLKKPFIVNTQHKIDMHVVFVTLLALWCAIYSLSGRPLIKLTCTIKILRS